MKQKLSTKSHNFQLLIIFASLIVFLFIIADYFFFGILVKYDSAANQIMGGIRTPVLTVIMAFFTSLINYPIIIILSAALSLVLLLSKRKNYFALLIISILTGYFLEYILKIIIHKPRPLNAIISVSSYSLPSGHAAISAIFFLVVLFSFIKGIKNKACKTVFAAICLAFPLIISFSRIYFGAHWLSDILAGIFLGCFVVFSFLWIFKKEKYVS